MWQMSVPVVIFAEEKGGIMHIDKTHLALGLIVAFGLALLSCAPGDDRWDQEINPDHEAGFWAGIWHGLIIIITFVVSLFTKEVGIYETSNTGWPYNLGFLIGLFCSVGSGIRIVRKRRTRRKREWDEIGEKVERKIRKALKAWLEETEKEQKEKEWHEIASKIEERIKKALSEWSEED
jgi:hypothetical protein